MIKTLTVLLLIIPSIIFGLDQDSTAVVSSQEVVYDLNSDQNIRKFDSDQIEQFKTDDDFNYTERIQPENAWTRFKNWLGQLFSKFLRWIFGVEEVSGFWAVVFQILPYIVIIGVLLLLIRLFMKVNPKDLFFEKQEVPQVSLSEDEDIIQNQDIQQLINQALLDKNYRLAVRYYYLFILKKLSDKELITWESQKTNTDYIKELSDLGLKDQFQIITRLYDFIWYGNFAVDEKSYANAEKKFISITKAIQ